MKGVRELICVGIGVMLGISVAVLARKVIEKKARSVPVVERLAEGHGVWCVRVYPSGEKTAYSYSLFLKRELTSSNLGEIQKADETAIAEDFVKGDARQLKHVNIIIHEIAGRRNNLPEKSKLRLALSIRWTYANGSGSIVPDPTVLTEMVQGARGTVLFAEAEQDWSGGEVVLLTLEEPQLRGRLVYRVVLRRDVVEKAE